MSWQNPKIGWVAGEIPSSLDFNRIEANIDFIENSDRTPSDAQTPAASGSLLDIQNYFASMIKKITGKSSWIDTPRTTLENAVKLSGDTMLGDLVMEGHSIKIRRPQWEGGWAEGYAIKDIDDTPLVEFGTHGGVNSGVNTTSFHYIGKAYNDTFMRFYEDKRVTIDGDVILGSYSAFKKLSVILPHTFNVEDSIFLGSKYSNKYYGVGLYYGLSEEGSPYAGVARWYGDVMHKQITLKSSNTGINNEDPLYPLDVNGIVRAEGLRPIQLDPGNGQAKIKGLAGGWALGYFFEGSGGAFLGGFGAHGGTDALNYYYIGAEYNNPLLKIQSDGMVKTKGDRIAFRLDSIEDHGTNGLGRISVNYYGYQGGTTQFRDFRVYDGRAGLVAHFDGETKGVDFSGRGVFDGGAEALALKPGTRDYTYMGFYPRTSQPDLLGGYLGYGGTADTEMTMANLRGDVRIITQDKLIVQGSIESNNVKVPIMKKIIEGTAIFDSTSSPHPIELVVEENKHHIFVYNVYCTTYNPIIFGYDANENCAYIDTRASETLMPRLMLTNHSSTTKSYKYIVYELVV